MKHLSTWKVAFSTTLLAVVMLAGSTSIAKAKADPCQWPGNCPRNFCPAGSIGQLVGTCTEQEPCASTGNQCDVLVINGWQCKANCQPN